MIKSPVANRIEAQRGDNKGDEWKTLLSALISMAAFL
jgi:hypothetical protein